MAAAYLTPREVGRLHAQNQNTMSFIHINAQSARNKEDEILALLATFAFEHDIIMITETWYETDLDVLRPPGYTTYFINRSSKRGGGVLLMAKNNSRCHLVASHSYVTCDYEVLTVKSRDTLFCVLYRPPGSNVSNFLSFFDSYLSWVNENRFKLILGGDLNIDFLKISNTQRDLHICLASNGFVNTIQAPTRIQNSSATLLDVFITNIHECISFSGVLNVHISDHLPIVLLLSTPPSIHKVPDGRVITRDISSSNLDRFRDAISLVEWSDIMRTTDPDTAYDCFHEKFKMVYYNCFPYKSFNCVRKGKKLWITKKCLKEIRIKNKLYKEFIQTKDNEKFKQFKTQRNKLNNLLRYEKRRYMHNLFSTGVMKRSDIAWKKINSVLNRNTNSHDTIHEVIRNSEILSNAELANAFNDYFISVCKSAHNPNYANFMNESTCDSAFLAPVTLNEIVSAFLSLKNSGCPDVDGLEIRPIKYVLDLVSPVLEHVFNLIFTAGTFPKQLQMAKVIVLHKGGDKNEFTNYRPIAILPIFSKGLEKLIHTRMISFLDRHKIITTAQFGFVKGLSTETALLAQKEAILYSFEQQLYTLGIFIDYSKAFDCIDHVTLLKKLSHYGFRGTFLQLLTSYLSSRQQKVLINNHSSCFKPVSAGVPQGSILGPLLFCIYINDLANIDSSANIIMYADDTTMLLSAKNQSDVFRVSNELLDKLSRWSRVNSLTINANKTKAVLFRPRNRTVHCQHTLKLGNSEIEIVPTVKCLGVVFEQHMSWNAHVDLVLSKLSRITGVLSKLRFCLPKSVKLVLYRAMFLSHLQYCHLVWGTTTQANIAKLSKVQKKAVRIIMNAAYDSHTASFFEDMKLLPVTHFYKSLLLKRYQTNVKRNNNVLCSISKLQLKMYPRNIRRVDRWQIPKNRTNYGEQMLRYQLPFHLNNVSCI